MLHGTRKVAAVFTQRHFDEYARLSGDDNPIHVDPAFAAGTRFGRTVAHGMFLFSTLQAALAGHDAAPVRLRSQSFVFRAPTFTGDALLLGFDSDDGVTVGEKVTDSDGQVTTTGVAVVGEPSGSSPGDFDLKPSGAFKGLEVGMTAGRTKHFTRADVADFVNLVRDPNPLFTGASPEMPPGLLAGMESWVLGVDLPGRGTNWLKQTFEYHYPVIVPATVTCTVTVTRIRADKGLVNLATRGTVDDRTVVSGEALVLATDIADPSPA